VGKFKGGYIDHECPLPRESDELEKECAELEEELNSIGSEKYRTLSVLDYLKAPGKAVSVIVKEVEESERKNIEEYLNECLKKKAKVDDEIQKCLNRRTYMAIKKRIDCFDNQLSWSISDCNTCEWYVIHVNGCILGREIRVTRGLCPTYKPGEPIDFEEVHSTEEEIM
jgi:hypothetical protein